MSSGLLALLDDVAALAKVAAATLDDAAAQASKAGAKAAGIVIDDAAVTPRYVVGFAAERELPIIWKIAKGSLRNKLLFLLPGALILYLSAPWLITPVLMIGGVYLCIEGFEKSVDVFKRDHAETITQKSEGLSPQDLENEKVKSAIRTDFILSAEIMAITLAVLTEAIKDIPTLAVVLGVVGAGMTVLVYGAVAIIVKLDDWGAAIARNGKGAVAAVGRGIVAGMPHFLHGLSLIGMVAMLWVGGGIIIHGLHQLGLAWPEQVIHHLAETAAHGSGALAGFVHWAVTAGISGVVGLIIGAVFAPPFHHYLLPMISRLRAGQTAAAGHRTH
jgi:predicted DNA repair protein MutK